MLLLVVVCRSTVWGDNLTVTVTNSDGTQNTETGQESLEKALEGVTLSEVEGIEVSTGSFETADWIWQQSHTMYLGRLEKFEVTGGIGNVANIPNTTKDSPYFSSSLNELHVAKLKKVGEFAFYNCSGLMSVSLPAARTIDDGAFSGCTGLRSVSLPAATSIYSGAFSGCTSLTSVSLPAATSLGDFAFSNCGKLESVSLPAATSIYRGAFSGCVNLTSVSLPAATEIWYSVFDSCVNLTSVSLPAATRIRASAFSKCAKLESVSLPVATLVEWSAFSSCENLTSVSLPAATKIGSSAFANCGKLESVLLQVATGIGESAFYNCENLTSVSLPAATEIGKNAFANCGNLTSVSLPSATNIWWGAFTHCHSLTSITLPSAMHIGRYAFERCKNLTSVSLPAATQIGEDAFEFCDNLTSVSLPAATQIGESAFKYCEKLTSVSLPVATYIDRYTFRECKNLKSVSLPSATYIGYEAFEDCKNLRSVSVPKITSIEFAAFRNCWRLKALKLGDTPPSVEDKAFEECPSERTLIITDSMGVPLVGAALESAAKRYDVNEGSYNDGKWYGWTIEKNPPTMLTVIVEPTGTGAITITRKDDGTVVNKGDELTKGEVLVVSTTPIGWCKYKKTTAVGAKDNGNNEWEVTAEPGEQVAFTVEFVKITPLGATIINPAEGGTVGITRKDGGAEVNEGDELTKGETLVVTTKPSSGYEHKKTTAVGAKDNGNNEWEVTAEPGEQVVFTAVFEKLATLGVTIKTPAGAGEVTITRKDGGAVVSQGDVLKEGAVLVVAGKPVDGYRVKAITAAGAKKIGEGNEWEVTAMTGEVIFTVEFEKVATLGATVITPAGSGTVSITRKASGDMVNKGDALTKDEVLIVKGEPDGTRKVKKITAAGATNTSGNEWKVTANPGEQVVFTVKFEKAQEENSNNDPTPVESVLLAQVQLSPNPTNGQVTIDAGTTLARCEVYSSMGALLQAIESPESVFTIDLTASPSGVYLVRLVDMHGGCKTLRVVKQ